MSDLYSSRVLRAVRLLDTAVRVGRGGLEEITDAEGGEKSAASSSAPHEKMSEEAAALAEAEAEIRKLKAELRERDLSVAETRESAERLQGEMQSLRAALDKEREELYAKVEKDAAERSEAASREGYESGSTKGYEDGVAKAEAEKRAEYEGKFSEAIALLDSIGTSLQNSREELTKSHAPQLIRLWQMMLERMLQTKVDLDEDSAKRMLESVLRRVSDRERVIVYLNPADISMIQNSREDLIDTIRGVKSFEFLSDDHVDKGSCLVETNLGIYDARWRTQLEQVAGEVESLLMECIATDVAGS